MTATTCRWGILGCANIARKNWKGLRHAGNATLTAVASRDRERARQFIDACQSDVPFPTPPAACGSYEELLARPDVDAVYVPLPTGIRKDWVIRAAEAGKHILCEKPCGCTASDLRAMLDACARANVQFMDGVMFMHSQRLPLLRQVLDDASTVGTLRRITSQFTFLAPEAFYQNNIRASQDMEPLGCLGDLGWYNLRFSLWGMRYQMPQRVTGRLLARHGTVPTEFSGELFFAEGVSASFYCSFRTQNSQWATLSGTAGYAHLADFVLPFLGPEVVFEVFNTQFNAAGCTFRMENHPRRYAVAEYDAGAERAQEVNMVRTFSDLALAGKPDPHWADIAWKTQVVMDACLQSARDGSREVFVTAG